MMPFSMTLVIETLTSVSRSHYFSMANISEQCVFIKLQMMLLLSLQCIVPLTLGPSSIAESLVVIPAVR